MLIKYNKVYWRLEIVDDVMLEIQKKFFTMYNETLILKIIFPITMTKSSRPNVEYIKIVEIKTKLNQCKKLSFFRKLQKWSLFQTIWKEMTLREISFSLKIVIDLLSLRLPANPISTISLYSIKSQLSNKYYDPDNQVPHISNKKKRHHWNTSSQFL